MGMLELPDEILEQVLVADGVCARDVCAFARVCQRTRALVARSAVVWRRLFSVHFPSIAHALEERVRGKPHDYWRDLFVARYSVQPEARAMLAQLAPAHHHRRALSNCHMEHFLTVENASELDGQLMNDALRTLVTEGDTDSDLTVRYYGRQVAQFVNHHFMAARWDRLRNESVGEPYCEALVLIAEWFQPLEFVSRARVECDIRWIARQVIEKIAEKFPENPVSEQGGNSGLIITTSQAFNIFDCINETLYVDNNFRGNTANYSNPANSFIDKVLQGRQGIPITLCMIYYLVAKMVGIKLTPINFPRHFMLRWDFNDVVYYIDAFQGGKRLTEAEAKTMVNGSDLSNLDVATPMKVAQRMVRNLVAAAQVQEQEAMSLRTSAFPLLRSALELTKMIGEDFEYPGFALCQLYLQLSINHREVVNELDNSRRWLQNVWFDAGPEVLEHHVRCLKKLCFSNIAEENAEREEITSFRNQLGEVHGSKCEQEFGCYAVGMVMKHRRYNYFCVIFGWDPVCRASQQWIIQMGVDRLSRRDGQPFYNVLVEDGSIRYAADESLRPVKPRRIDHALTGKYFDKFDPETGYKPNSELAKEYPEDEPVAVRLVRSRKTSETG